ncbi:endospore germination permease [Metabacillus lacus]|uniref:endospore germination permease n=1 Tax=Metabacillus lacus TaxID=1983721 RepID=UPI0012AF44EC
MTKKPLTPAKLFFLVIQTQIGIGVLSLPFDLSQEAKHDGWISLLLAGVIVQFFLAIYYILLKRFPGRNFYGILICLFGNLIGKILICLYLLYFSAVAVVILTRFEEIVGSWVLPETPSWLIGFMLLFIAVYLAREPIVTIANFVILVTPLLLILIVLPLFTLEDANPLFLLPVAHTDWKKILLGSREAVTAMLGFEVILILYPMVNGAARAVRKAAFLSGLFTVLFYVYLTIMSYIYFSPNEIELIPEPVLYLLKAIPFQVIERTDLLFLSLWIVSVFTSIAAYAYVSLVGLATLTNQTYHRKYGYLYASCIFLFSLYPGRSKDTILAFSEFVSQLSFGFIFLFPSLILIISFFIKKRRAANETSTTF